MAPGQPKQNNVLHIWGNEKTMNLNSLILTNIQSSHYFKVNLYELKTYHEVIDEIYYKVGHLEPWEKGSRKTSGQTGMCGGVRGVGAGGIVSTAYCLLYKLFTLKLTRKQVNGLINHTDSPYIRGLGFMYIRYTQQPADLWDWYEAYLDDEEEIDPKAGGGSAMTIGQLVRNFLTKLEWYSSLFPRIPVPIQKEIERKLNEHKSASNTYQNEEATNQEENEEFVEQERPRSHSREKTRRDDRRHDDRDKQGRSDRSRAHHEKSRRHKSPERSRHYESRYNGDIADQIEREKRRQEATRESGNRRRYRSRSRERSSHRSHKSDRRHRSRSRDRARR